MKNREQLINFIKQEHGLMLFSDSLDRLLNVEFVNEYEFAREILNEAEIDPDNENILLRQIREEIANNKYIFY